MKQTALNWHPADISAAIAKKGSNLSRIAREAGISHSSTKTAIRARCYVGEQAIAVFIGVAPHIIWPNRYDSKGIPLHPRIRKNLNVSFDIKSSQKCTAV